MIQAIGSAMTGIASATNRFDRAASRIAHDDDLIGSSVDGRGLPSAVSAAGWQRGVVDQITAKHDLAANVATIRTADEMIGSLIDIMA